jgi:pre-60S factor REI1
MCLSCDTSGRHFSSMEAARKHMIDKSHCKLPYEDGPDEELADFYDFTSRWAKSLQREFWLVPPTIVVVS